MIESEWEEEERWNSAADGSIDERSKWIKRSEEAGEEEIEQEIKILEKRKNTSDIKKNRILKEEIYKEEFEKREKEWMKEWEREEKEFQWKKIEGGRERKEKNFDA